jgi:hypothetical protein
MPWWKLLTFLGLFLNLVGVWLLFFYVLPRRMRTDGTLFSWQNSSNPDQKLIKLERRWDILSGIGLACVIIGILLQAVGVWIS